MIFCRFFLPLGLGLFLIATASAQSFHCGEGLTAVERSICGERKLGDLDYELSLEVRKSLAADAERREALLKEQRHWMKARDSRCGAFAGVDAQRAEAAACLSGVYEARIAELRETAAKRRLPRSIDCALTERAHENTKLICFDPVLMTLDATLARELEKAATPSRREALLRAHDDWSWRRVGNCVGDYERRRSCLLDLYRKRIDLLRAPMPEDRHDICRRLGARYAALLAKDPEAPYKKSFYAESPLHVLAAAPDAGVMVAAPAANIGDVTRAKLAAWAKAEPQPFVFPDALAAEIVALAHYTRLVIDRLPDEAYYAAGVTQGTLHCYSAIYFTVAGGVARKAAEPEGGGEDGCGLSPAFGRFDGAPVAYGEGFDHTPSLSSYVEIIPWRSGGFGPACTAHFEFAPRFAERATYNQWEEHCAGADCEILRKEALALVEAAQKQPLAARKAALARLSATQAVEFAKMEEAAGLAHPFSGDPDDPAQYSDEGGTLKLPLLHGGRLYLAELGHFTIGWRVFSDWRVTLEQLDKGKLAESSVFAIGMTKGALRGASAK